MKVERFLKEKGNAVLSFHENTPVVEAASQFGNTVEGKKFSVSFVVDDNKHVIGVLSLGDIVHGLALYKGELANMTVGQLETKTVFVATLDDDLQDVLKSMSEHDVRHVPAVKDGALVGIIALKDVLETLHGEAMFQMKNLTEYVFKTGGRY